MKRNKIQCILNDKSKRIDLVDFFKKYTIIKFVYSVCNYINVELAAKHRHDGRRVLCA